MSMPRKCFLVDGPLMLATERRAALVTAMAADLKADGTYAERTDAHRSLSARGYSAFDISLLIDDARQVAVQEQVWKEMAGS